MRPLNRSSAFKPYATADLLFYSDSAQRAARRRLGVSNDRKRQPLRRWDTQLARRRRRQPGPSIWKR
jgi:hypothetical protein